MRLGGHESGRVLGGDNRLGVLAVPQQLSEAVHLRAQVVLGLEQVDDLAQLGAGGVLGVGEVVHLHAHLGEAFLEGAALLGALPVVALEEDVKGLLLPGFELVGDGFDVHFVHVIDVADDGGALLDRDDGAAALGDFEDVVVHDACDQVVAVLLGLAENLEVTVVEEVVGTCGVANNHEGFLVVGSGDGHSGAPKESEGEERIRPVHAGGAGPKKVPRGALVRRTAPIILPVIFSAGLG